MAEIQFRPTLVIGLGGTGKEVVLLLKARFLENLGQVPEILRFLVLDTTLATEEVQGDLGERVYLSPIEFQYLGNIDANDIVENLHKFPFIAEWFPKILRPGVIDRGAAMVRAIGRLALFWRVQEVVGALDAAIRNLMALANIPLTLQPGALTQEQGISIFIVSSLCGGTGGGMFLDMAYLAQDVLRQVGLLGVSKVVGALVLPGAFPRAADQYNLQANAYAALKELDYLMDQADFRCEYSTIPPLRVSLRRRPFDVCYLIDTINENRRRLEDVHGVAHLIAEALFLFIASDTGKKLEDLEINIRDRLTRYSPPDTNKPAAYSSFGTSSLVLPVERLIQACGLTLASHLVEQGLLRQVEDWSRLQEEVKRFLDAHSLRIDGGNELLMALLRDSQGRPLKVELDPLPLLDMPQSEVLNETRAYVAHVRREEMSTIENRLRENAAAWEQQVLAALEQHLVQLLNDPTKGLLYGMRWLEEMGGEFEHSRQRMREEQEALEKKREAAEQNLNAFWNGLEAAVNSFVLFRRRRIEEALQLYLSTYEEVLQAHLQALSRQWASRLFATWGHRLEAWRSELEALRVTLADLGQQFRLERRRMETFREVEEFVLERSLVTEADLEALYREQAPPLADALASLMASERQQQAQGLWGWRSLKAEEIRRRLLRFAEQQFAPLRRLRLDGPQGYVARRGLDPDQILDRLMSFAVPFWNYSDVRARGVDLATVEVVGVEDEANSLFAAALQRRPGEAVTATTHDPYRITVTRARHGLPLFALTMIDNWKQAYDTFLRSGRRPVHVLPHAEDLPEPLPEAGKERARMIFALALAPVYGFIRKIGPHYTVVDFDPSHPERTVELASEREDAEEAFLRQEDLVEMVGRRITARNQELGNARLKAALEEYLSTLRPTLPEQERQIQRERRRIEEYLQELEK